MSGRLERGTAALPARLAALRKLALPLPTATMKALRAFFEREIAARLPRADVLYWT